MSVESQIASFLRVANEDLRAAHLLQQGANRNAAYHCQQAAEKVVRAVLTSEGIHAGIRHHLEQMVDLVPDANPVKPLLRAVEGLSVYATTYRYPTPSGRIPVPPTAEEFAELAASVEVALLEAAHRFGVDLAAAAGPALHPGPIR